MSERDDRFDDEGSFDDNCPDSVTVEVEIEKDGITIGGDVEVFLEWSRDKYGEDADGNRGEWRNECEATGAEIQGVVAYGNDGEDVGYHGEYDKELIEKALDTYGDYL